VRRKSRLQHLAAGELRPHRHRIGYAALILDGSYLEAGNGGRWRLQPGDLVVHGAFDAHRNLVGTTGATVLNIDLPRHVGHSEALRVTNPDDIACVAREDPARLPQLLDEADRLEPVEDDWQDLLAAAMRADPALSLSGWAAAMGLQPATVSRGFKKTFGMTPALYRRDLRTIAALEVLVNDVTPIASIAHDCGFADQAHLCRSLLELTGGTPSQWRKSNSFKTKSAPPV
jgi:AraC-like DNA-binding protein